MKQNKSDNKNSKHSKKKKTLEGDAPFSSPSVISNPPPNYLINQNVQGEINPQQNLAAGGQAAYQQSQSAPQAPVNPNFNPNFYNQIPATTSTSAMYTAPGLSPNSPEEKVKSLQEMGFEKENAVRALEANNYDLESAMNSLLASPAPTTITATPTLPPQQPQKKKGLFW